MSPKFNLAIVRKLIFTLFVSCLIFYSGYFIGFNGYKAEVKKGYEVRITRLDPPDKNVNFDLFWKVWDMLAIKYFDKTKIIPSEMVYGAIAGMVSSLGDPYTIFLSPKENKVANEDLSGSFEGVGIQIGYKKTNLAVIAPLLGSPAERAGVKAGDYIIHLKDDAKKIDIDTSGITLPEAVQIIRGKAGSKITITLFREGVDKPFDVILTREKLDVPSVTLKIENNVATIKVNKFSAETYEEWQEVVSEVINHKSSILNLVIDLRNNPGGYLQAAVDLAGDFIDVGKVVVVEERSDGTKNEYKVEKLGKLHKYNVTVLINEGSASASEILAGALRDQRGFKLIGTKSFGKGTIQEPIEINGGSGLHVTTAKWLTPSGTWVHGEGLKPDVEVEDNPDTPEDEQLNEAIKLISNYSN